MRIELKIEDKCQLCRNKAECIMIKTSFFNVSWKFLCEECRKKIKLASDYE